MRLLPQYFSESSTFVVEAGEATGNLAPILAKIILHIEEKREIKNKVLSSMTYPVFVGTVAFGVVLFFLFFSLLPQIEEMLDSLGGELNMMAKVLINGSNFVLTFGPFVLIGILVGMELYTDGVNQIKAEFFSIRIYFAFPLLVTFSTFRKCSS